MPSRSWLAAAMAVVAGCNNDSLTHVYPDIRLCASESDTTCAPPLDLGTFRVGEKHSAALVARNDGEGILEIKGVEVISGAVTPGELPSRIAAMGLGYVGLLVTPVEGASSARVAVLSNDPESPRVEVDLVFSGVQPLLVFCPGEGLTSTPGECAADLSVDIGELQTGQVRDIAVLVRNTGTAPIEIAGAAVEDLSTIAGELTVITATGRGSLDPGAEGPLVVRYQPRDGLPDLLHVTLTPGDESVGGPVLHASGTAIANQVPTAVAVEYTSRLSSVSAEVGQAIWLDGTGSSDPESDPLQYSWSITGAPLGSTAPLEHADAARARLVPDKLGAYGVQLQVSDSLGLVGFADVTMSVSARYALDVVARWGTSAGDVDLHLLPEGEALFGAGDCYFGQPTRDWGEAANALDDPELLADDVSSSGREIIRLRRPAASRYEIWVNYFDSMDNRPAEVAVEVQQDDGTVTLRSTEGVLTATCESWHVGTIDWPAGTVTLAAAPHTSRCYGGTP